MPDEFRSLERKLSDEFRALERKVEHLAATVESLIKEQAVLTRGQQHLDECIETRVAEARTALGQQIIDLAILLESKLNGAIELLKGQMLFPTRIAWILVVASLGIVGGFLIADRISPRESKSITAPHVP